MYNASPGIYAPVPVRLRSQPIIDWPTSYETRARPSSIISECNECIMDADSKLRPISTNLFDFGRILIDIYCVSCDLRPFNYPYGEEAGFRKEEVSLSSSPQEEKKRVRITVDRPMEERRKKSFAKSFAMERASAWPSAFRRSIDTRATRRQPASPP